MRAATVVQDQYLPAIFKRRQQKLAAVPAVVDDPNILAPQQPAPAPMTIVPSNPTLADKYMAAAVPETAPPAIAPASPNMLASAPVSPSGQIMDENATRARRVETDKRGRPIPNATMQGDQQTLDYNDRLARMSPDKAGGGWWPKIMAAIAGFAAGGPVGAAAAFGTRALREHFDPTLGSREYKSQKMREIAPAVANIQQTRKDALDLQSKTATIDLAKARTDALKNPKTKPADRRIIERKDGVYAIDPVSLKTEKLADIPAEAGTPGSTRYISRADGVYGINAEHPSGFRVKGIPGNPGKDVEDVTFGNAHINQAIAEAQSEQKKIDEGLAGIPRTIEGVDPVTGVKKMVVNPDYSYNMSRRRKLDDDIRNWRIKLKSAKKPAKAKEDDNDPLGILGDDE